MKRLAAATITGGVVAGGLLLAGGAANAMPSDTPCGASDVITTVTKSPEGAAGHEAFLITYTAASDTTNCTLQGTPTAVGFVADGRPVTGVTATPDTASEQPPVNLRAGHPAESRIIQRADAAPVAQIPTSLIFDLPTGPYGQPVTTAWPAGEPLRGSEVVVTPVSAN